MIQLPDGVAAGAGVEVTPGSFARTTIVGAEGPDLVAGPLRPVAPPRAAFAEVAAG